MCWLGDPCYIIHRKQPEPGIGANWHEFVEHMYAKGEESQHAQFGRALGVCVCTGYGDGVYDVQVRKTKEGRIKEVRIKFI